MFGEILDIHTLKNILITNNYMNDLGEISYL